MGWRIGYGVREKGKTMGIIKENLFTSYTHPGWGTLK